MTGQRTKGNCEGTRYLACAGRKGAMNTSYNTTNKTCLRNTLTHTHRTNNHPQRFYTTATLDITNITNFTTTMDPVATETPDVTSSNSQGGHQDHNTSQAHTVQTEPGTTGDKTTVGGQDTQESSECNGYEDKIEELTLDPFSQTGAYLFFTSPWRIHLSLLLLHIIHLLSEDL